MAAKKKAETKPKTARIEYPAKRFKDAAALDAWLAKNHATSPGLRLEMAKAGTGIPSINWKQTVEVVLAWGWIDGKSKRLDDTWFHQQITPRGKKSVWSKVNRDKVAALTEAGRMQPSGLAAVEAAKADGRWDAAYDSPRTSSVPDDLSAELARNPVAAAFFASLDSQNRYAILHRLQTATKPETRARRLATFVQMLVEGRRVYD